MKNCLTGDGLRVQDLELQEGFWRSGVNDSSIVECPSRKACSGGTLFLPGTNSSSSPSGLCSAGNEGPLCDVCRAEYVRDYDGTCKPCEETVKRPINILFTVLFILGVAGAIVCFVRHKLRAGAAEGERTANILSSKLVRITKDRHYWVYRLRTKLKIIVSCFQIVTEFQATLNINYPPIFSEFSSFVSKIVNLELLGLVSLGCLVPLNFHQVRRGEERSDELRERINGEFTILNSVAVSNAINTTPFATRFARRRNFLFTPSSR